MIYDFKAYLKPWKEEKFVENLPDTVYHAEPALSSGQIMTILDDEDDGGLHVLKAEKEGKRVRAESDALRFGTIFHKAALEGPEFLKKFRVQPDFGDMRSSTNRAKRDAWRLDQPAGTIILDDGEELEQITGMVNSLLAHPVAKILLTGGRRELSGFANVNGYRCRIRVDIFQDTLFMLNDLKTTRNAKKRAFQRQIILNMYYVQAAFYCMVASKILGTPIRAFNFIAIEKKWPYLVSVHEVGESLLTAGEKMIDKAMTQLRAAIETGVWFPEPQIAFTAEAPEYLMNRIESEAF